MSWMNTMVLPDDLSAPLAPVASPELGLARRGALQSAGAAFHALADTMPQMIWSTLPDGDYDYFNAQWYRFTGVRDGSTDGEGWAGMFHPDDQPEAWSRWRHSLETGEPYEVEYRLRRHDGRVAIAIMEEPGLIRMNWTERDGPKIEAVPDLQGFGSTQTKLAVEQQLGGTLERDWRSGGLVVTMTVRAERIKP